jgi:hypothetical protein
MKQRRAKAKSYIPRWPTGTTVRHIIAIGDFEQAFLQHIDTSGGDDACHIWTHTKTKLGYGHFTKHGYTALAHRLRYAMAEPDSIHAQVIMHLCDNPQCCNPRHLRAGSYADNTQDMLTKGRRTAPLVSHLSNRDTHPRAKPVTTPYGDFPSAALAAEASGWNVRRVCRYCLQQRDGWSYV